MRLSNKSELRAVIAAQLVDIDLSKYKVGFDSLVDDATDNLDYMLTEEQGMLYGEDEMLEFDSDFRYESLISKELTAGYITAYTAEQEEAAEKSLQALFAGIKAAQEEEEEHETLLDVLRHLRHTNDQGSTIALCDGGTDWHIDSLIDVCAQSDGELEQQAALCAGGVYTYERDGRTKNWPDYTIKIGRWTDDDEFEESQDC